MTESKRQLFGTPQPKFGLNSLLRFDKKSKESRKISTECPVHDVRTGLVGYWNDDGKSATTWLDQADGHLNNGTIYGAGTPPSATPGALGYVFDGIDDYVDIGNNASLAITGTKYSVSLWVYNNDISLAAGHVMLSRRSTTNNLPILYQIYSSSSKLIFITRSDTGGNAAVAQPSSNQSNSVWYHVVGVRNGTNVYLYINGIQVGSDNDSGGVITTNTTYIGAANNAGSVSAFHNGSIDEVRIYNRALGADEIGYLYQKYRIKFGV